MSPSKAIGDVYLNEANSSDLFTWNPNMSNEILPAILVSNNLYMIVSISTMILINIGVIFAIVFLALKKKFRRMSPLDYFTINLLLGCGLFSISNFVTYSYYLFNKHTPANTCIFVQTMQSILWYNEFITVILLITERTYKYTSPINHMKKFTAPFLLSVITGGWLVASFLGVLCSFPYNWSKIQLDYKPELCHCESLLFKKVDIAIHVGSLLVPYVLVVLSFPIARISALKDALQVRKDLGLNSLNKFYTHSKNDSFYAAEQKILIRQKLFYGFLFITHSMKIVIFFLKEFNNYQKVILSNTHDEDTNEKASNPYYLPSSVIGLLNLLYLMSPIFNLICCTLINKSFFKKPYLRLM